VSSGFLGIGSCKTKPIAGTEVNYAVLLDLPRCSIGPAVTDHPFLPCPLPSSNTVFQTPSLSTGMSIPTASFPCNSSALQPTDGVAPSCRSSWTAKTPDKLTAVRLSVVLTSCLKPAGPYIWKFAYHQLLQR